MPLDCVTLSRQNPISEIFSRDDDAARRKLEDDHHNGSASAALLAATSSIYEAHGWVTDARAGTAFSGTTVTTWLDTAHTLYTPTGKPAAVTDADTRTTVTAYDALDRTATVTDPVGKAVHNSYDAAGQLLVEYRGWATPLQQAYATHSWTLNGKEASVYDADGAAHLTQYHYDGFDRLSSTIYADASHEDLSYDADSNILTRLTRSGATLAYAYDLLDRLRTKTVPATSANPAHTIASAYTLAGRPTSLTDSAGPVVATGYDTAGRATSETQTILGIARTVASQLDAASNRTKLTWPDGFAVDYTFDALNRMSTATVTGGPQLALYGYDPLSRRTSLSYNSGSSSIAYGYSNAGDLLTLTNTLAGGASVGYTNTFTPAHQLASADISNPDYVRSSPAASSSYTAVNNLNQYPSVDGGGLSWDGNGNLSAITSATYAHDPENRLVAATVSGSPVAYTYDPLGRRSVSGLGTASSPLWNGFNWGAANWTWAWASATAFVHDGPNEIAEYDVSNTLIRRFVPGPAVDDYVAMVTTTGATTFFHTDRQGSVIAMADTTGARIEGPYTYDAYGNCFVGTSTTSCTTLASTTVPFRFTGQRFDIETGLYYYRARYYGPGIGRFYETDPAGYGPDVNWYSYVGNDPTDKEDPTGLFGPCKIDCPAPTAPKTPEEKKAHETEVRIIKAILMVTVALIPGGVEAEGATTAVEAVATTTDTEAAGGGTAAVESDVAADSAAARGPADTAGTGGRGGNQFRGRLREAEGPHSRFRTDAQGRVTHYETYDHPTPGRGLRVDVEGAPHGGVDTPHATETTEYVNPADPSKRGFTEGPTRPANADEIPAWRQ